jgi:adenylate kinase family enzyme
MKYLTEKNIIKYIDTEEKLSIFSTAVVIAIANEIPFYKVGDVAIDSDGVTKKEYEKTDNFIDNDEKEERKIIVEIINSYLKGVDEKNTLLIGYSLYTSIHINKKYTKNMFGKDYVEKFDMSFISFLLEISISFNASKESFFEKLNYYYTYNLSRIFEEIDGTVFEDNFERHIIYILKQYDIDIDNAFYNMYNEDD